jgi:hypothetical protein
LQIARTEEGSFIVSELDPPLIGLFMAIPEAADPGENVAANERLYPKPSADHGMREEWREYVEPGLREWFESASATVKRDLEQLGASEELTILPEHVDAWLSALNQARLALAARFEVNDSDMEQAVSPVLQNERELALFQIHFYGFLQECLIRGLESEDGEEY